MTWVPGRIGAATVWGSSAGHFNERESMITLVIDLAFASAITYCLGIVFFGIGDLYNS